MASHPHNNHSSLRGKLRLFKVRYESNLLAQGLIIFIGLFIISLLAVSGLEAVGRYGTGTRTFLFYTFLAINAVVLLVYILLPLYRILNLRKSLSDEKAAAIVGLHFPQVQDKLLNTLQLQASAEDEADPFSKELLLASVEQRTQQIRPLPFVKAVDYTTSKRYLKYLALPLLLFIMVLVLSPEVFDSSKRLMAHNMEFIPQAPFSFKLLNDDLVAVRNEPYEVQLEIEGEQVPSEVYLHANNQQILMKPDGARRFITTLRDLKEHEYSLYFSGSGYNSISYRLQVLAPPALQRAAMVLTYPSYTRKASEELQTAKDITIPEGTRITWKLDANNTDELLLVMEADTLKAEEKGRGRFEVSKSFKQSTSYYLVLRNSDLRSRDSVRYQLTTIPDAYPTISLSTETDSNYLHSVLVGGEIGDDYGLFRLVLHYSLQRAKGGDALEKSIPIPLRNNSLLQQYSYYWDFDSLMLEPGDELSYYLQVWDNDGVNGSKSSRTARKSLDAPSLEELRDKKDKSAQDFTAGLSKSYQKARELQKEMQELRSKLVNKKNMDWQDKKASEKLLKMQKELGEELEKLQEQFDRSINEQKEYNNLSQETMEKYNALQELMDQMMDSEMMQLLQEIQQMIEEQNKEGLQERLEEMTLQDKEVQKELDRMMELFKQAEFDEKLEDVIDQLDQLQQEQEKLGEDIKNAEKNNSEKLDELKQEQQELNKEFEKLQEEMQELQEKNEELENKRELGEFKQEEESIKKDMKDAEKALDEQKKKEGEQKAKDASQKMKEMKEELKKQQSAMKQKQSGENYESLRQILDNLIYLSFEQERLIERLQEVNRYSPEYVEIAQSQRKLQDDSKIIEDSLLALSKREPAISSFVNKEIGAINFNMDKAIRHMGDRNIGAARSDQQYVMTSVNNLAVLLMEAMENMQQQMSEDMKDGKPGSCPNPKPGGSGNKPMSMEQLRKLQQQMGQELGKMKQGLQQGNQGMSKQLAQMAAQQEALRRALQKMKEGKGPKPGEKGKDGQGGSGDELKELQELMDQNEEDLLNKRINEQTIQRQQEIVTRMLEAEKAEKKQEFDEKRKAEQASDVERKQPPLLQKYLKERQKEVEVIRLVPASLKPYYKEKVKEYFQSESSGR